MLRQGYDAQHIPVAQQQNGEDSFGYYGQGGGGWRHEWNEQHEAQQYYDGYNVPYVGDSGFRSNDMYRQQAHQKQQGWGEESFHQQSHNRPHLVESTLPLPPPPPPLQGSFETKIFKGRYQRNNKRGGLKNLRCFPSCGFRHKERGFCGRSVEVEIGHPPGMSTENYRSWVEFVKRDDAPTFTVGQKITIQELLEIERSKEEPIKPMVRGERLEEKCTDTSSSFEFNKERRGWHYGWTSNKHTCNAVHALQCYVFEASRVNPNSLVCRLVFQSPTFMLFCRRRRRFTLAPSAPHSAPTNRGKKKVDGEDDEDDEEDDEEGDEEGGADEGLKLENLKSAPPGTAKAPAASDAKKKPPAKRNRQDAEVLQGHDKKRLATKSPAAPSIEPSRPQPPATLTSQASSGVLMSEAGRKRSATTTGQVGGDAGRMENVMRRVAVIMHMLQKSELAETSNPSTRKNSATFLQDFPHDLFSLGAADSDMNAIFSQWSDDPIGLFDDGPLDSSQFAPLSPGGESTSFSSQTESHVVAATPQAKLKRTTSEAMMDDVALYMRQESGFERAIEQLKNKSANGTPNTFGFLKLVQEHLDSYRRSRNISRAEFDRVFNRAASKLVPGSFPLAASSNSSNGSVVAIKQEEGISSSDKGKSSGLFSSAFGALSSLVGGSGNSSAEAQRRRDEAAKQPPYLRGPGGLPIPNLAGHWRQTQEAENAMQELRSKMGTPWILSKMFEFMEHRFEVEINPEGCEMVTRLSRKWISNTTLRFKLDGESYHWGISLPAPFSQLSQGWSYRAWVDEHKIVLSHTIGDQQLTRIYWLNRDRSILHSTVILEVLEKNRWTEMGRVQQDAERE